jgi:hypothetical protein
MTVHSCQPATISTRPHSQDIPSTRPPDDTDKKSNATSQPPSSQPPFPLLDLSGTFTLTLGWNLFVVGFDDSKVLRLDIPIKCYYRSRYPLLEVCTVRIIKDRFHHNSASLNSSIPFISVDGGTPCRPHVRCSNPKVGTRSDGNFTRRKLWILLVKRKSLVLS